MTGCARETISRSLVRLKRMKWVSWDKHSIRLNASVVSRYAGDIAARSGSWRGVASRGRHRSGNGRSVGDALARSDATQLALVNRDVSRWRLR